MAIVTSSQRHALQMDKQRIGRKRSVEEIFSLRIRLFLLLCGFTVIVVISFEQRVSAGLVAGAATARAAIEVDPFLLQRPHIIEENEVFDQSHLEQDQRVFQQTELALKLADELGLNNPEELLRAATDDATTNTTSMSENVQGSKRYYREAFQWLVTQDPMALDSESDNLLQRFVLVMFYYATGGDGWDNPVFLKDRHECDWYSTSPSVGVLACNDKREVTDIQLAENHVLGSFPSEISFLSRLTNLELSSNQLTGTIPSQLSKMTQLTRLSLSSNQLTGAVPESLGTIRLLEQVLVHNNELSGSLSDTSPVCRLFSEGLLFNLWTDCAAGDGEENADVDCDCCTVCCSDHSTCGPKMLKKAIRDQSQQEDTVKTEKVQDVEDTQQALNDDEKMQEQEAAAADLEKRKQKVMEDDSNEEATLTSVMSTAMASIGGSSQPEDGSLAEPLLSIFEEDALLRLRGELPPIRRRRLLRASK